MNAKNAGRILVVDDNEVALDALAEVLRREGFWVLTTRGGMGALHQAKTDERVSLMLLDLWMPLMDGWGVLRQKKQEAHSAPLEMVFYDGGQFPRQYQGNAFVAAHGSWNRARKTGYKIVRVIVHNGMATGEYEDFMTGFVISNEKVWGRPVGVAVAPI